MKILFYLSHSPVVIKHQFHRPIIFYIHTSKIAPTRLKTIPLFKFRQLPEQIKIFSINTQRLPIIIYPALIPKRVNLSLHQVSLITEIAIIVDC